MPMSESSRRLLDRYSGYLFVAFLVSLGFLPITLQAGIGPAVAIELYATVVFGTSFFLLGLVRERIRLPLFSLNLLVQTFLITLTVIVGLTLLGLGGFAVLARRSPFDREVLREGLSLTGSKRLALFLGGGVLLAALINAYFAIDRKMGPGVLRNWMTGKYYSPREEERIFMFLDMRDSTALAERLGNIAFSALVRDVFRDLTDPLLRTKGSVSHYIGDEAVISWSPRHGLRDANCIRLFFEMRSTLRLRTDHYTKRYGLIPEFKAGVHIGPVVATEVGEIKSEIVFHGDVLNTASRIQALCNEESCPLLVSADLAGRLELPEVYRSRSLGVRKLKGKASDVGIVAIAEA